LTLFSTKIQTFFKLFKALLFKDNRTSLHIWLRHQGEVTNFYNLQYHVEKYPSFDIESLKYTPIRIGNKVKTAIILQGPIWYEDNFTLNTCKLYRMLYPSVDIYISIWDDDKLFTQKKWEDLRVTIIKTPKPQVLEQLGNIQLQTALVWSALTMAKQNQVQNIFKSRADQRMLDPHFLYGFHYYSCLLEKNIQRITFGLHDSIFHIPYKVNDQFMFGNIDDLMAYWQPDISAFMDMTREVPNQFGPLSPEQLLFGRYLKTFKNLQLDYTSKQYRSACAELIAFSDEGTEAMVWIKYPFRYKPHWEFNDKSWRQWRWYEWYNYATNKSNS
jgi:hypothetical protein